MSREFLNDLPPHLRAVYDKAATPDPMKTYFETLRQKEQMEAKTRESSVVYKLLGERMFGDLTIHGWLNLNTPMVNIRELNKGLIDEMAILDLMWDRLCAVGEGRTVITLPTMNDDGTYKTAQLYFSNLTCMDAIERTLKDLKEAQKDLIKMFHKPEDVNAYPHRDCVFTNQKEYEAVTAMRRMLSSLYHPANPANHSSNQGHLFYFRNTVKMKPLARAIGNIR